MFFDQTIFASSYEALIRISVLTLDLNKRFPYTGSYRQDWFGDQILNFAATLNNVSSDTLNSSDIIGLTTGEANQLAPYSSILSFNNDVGVVSRNSSNEFTFNGTSYGDSSNLFTLSGNDDITFDVKNEFSYGNFFTGSGDDVIKIINEVGAGSWAGRVEGLVAQAGSGNDKLYGGAVKMNLRVIAAMT